MEYFSVLKRKENQAPVTPEYNSSYSRGRDQEACNSKSARANNSQELASKKHITKRPDKVAQVGDPEFKPQYQRERSWEPVAHTYNPSYTGGRDQEGHGSEPA
jgi:hypothetical protein